MTRPCSWVSGPSTGNPCTVGERLESSGSFLIHICLVPRLGWVQMGLLTPTCDLSTIRWLHNSQTFYVVVQ